jgi:hypothetical protein
MYIGTTKYQQLTAADIDTYNFSKINALYTFNDTKIDVPSFVVRQVYCKLNYVKQYAEECLRIIRRSDPGSFFVIHDMPNTSEGGYGWAWQKPAPFAEWWRAVIVEIKKQEPSVTVGFPRIKRGWGIDLLQHQSHSFMRDSEYVFGVADFIGVDTMWSCGEDWTEMYNALYYIAYLQSTYKKPLVVTYHNHNNNVKKRVKGTQYIEFLRELNSIDGIIAAFCHTLSSGDPAEIWISWRTEKVESVIPSIFRSYLTCSSPMAEPELDT